MPIKLSDLPEFPEYTPGLADHEFLRQARGAGPLAKDKYGIISVFSMAHMLLFMDDRWTRQIELEGLRAAGVTEGPMFEFVRNVMLFANGQTHRNRRGPLVRTFAHRVIAELRPEVRTRIQTRIRSLRGTGRIEFVDSIAGPLPAEIIASIVGAPERDTGKFAAHVYSAIRGLARCSDEVRVESDQDMTHLTDYVDGLIVDRRAHPIDDLLSGYLARVSDGPMDEAEVRAQMVGLVVAGSDTTRGALTATVSQLLQHPEQWQMLVADPDTWVCAAVSEGLRFDPVIGSLARITLQDRVVDGVFFPAGTLVSISMLSVLRDPAVYENPDSFDITRTDHPRLHPVFGGGPHRCLGEALARIELEEALGALAREAPGLTLDGPPGALRGYSAVRATDPMHVRL